MNSVDRRGQGSASSSNSLQASPGYIGAGFIAPDTTSLDGRTQHPAQTTAPGNAPYGPFANGPSPAFTGRVAHQPFGAQEESGLFQSTSYYTVQTPVTQPRQQVGWVNENSLWEPSGQLATVGRVNYEMVPNNFADPVNEGSFNFNPYSRLENTMAEQHVDPHSGLLHVAGQYEFSGSLTSEPGGSQMGNLQPRISDTASSSSMSLQPDEYVDLSHDQYNQTEDQNFPMNYLEEPWSTTNMRSVEHVYSSLSPGTLEPTGSFATSMSTSTSHGSEEDGSSVPRYDHATSQATFDSEIDGMVESWATIREGGENPGSINPMPMNDRSPLHGLSSTYDQVLDKQVGIRFQLRIRGDTPSLMAGVEGDVDRAVQDMDTIVQV
ncbi:hypothetical protein EKO04_005940 [Ascochyta lentis]|uniref:Uncharacterized protein n=1 Tax=Ascochyta lentis TaxID=205686 RepID=A0A8H7J2W5_9PLEO|nr:hypothetical protein EKO04_005940 [Ascochyta lentis]